MRRTLLWCCALAMAVLGGCEGGPSTSSAPIRTSGGGAARAPKPERVEKPATLAVQPAVKPLVKQAMLETTAEGDRLYLAGEYAKAYDLYVKSIRARGSELDAHDGLARCAAAMGGYDKGCKFYEEMLKRNANDPYTLYGSAGMYLASGDRQMASATAYRSIRYNPNLSRSYYLIAVMQMTDSAPRLESAKRAFEQTLERESDYGPAYYQIALLTAGSSATRARSKAMAEKALETLRPVEKNIRGEATVLLGALYSADQENEKALAVFRQGLAEQGPGFYRKADIGLLLSRMGRTEEAKQEWGKMVEAFGLADPTGMAAYRQEFKSQTGNVDCSAFLPRSANKADYRDLVFHLGKQEMTPRITVPKEMMASLDEYRTAVYCEKMDLDGDGKEETVVVDARPVQDMGQEFKGANLPKLGKHWRMTNPNLYVFNARGGMVGSYSSHMDHFYQVYAVDFNNDGKKEIVMTEFSGGNQLEVMVLAKRGEKYQPVLEAPVECSDAACGFMAADLDGDGKRELMTVSGDPMWAEVYRFSGEGTFVECDKDFPRFYKDYEARYGKVGEQAGLRERLARARDIVGQSGAGGAEKPGVVKTSGSVRAGEVKQP